MSIRITQKNDYSSLFNSSSRNSINNDIVSLSQERASVKNGSYGKLLKAYYSDSDSASAKWAKSKANVVDTKNLSEVKASAVELKKDVSVINNKLIDSGNKDKIKEAVGEFVDSFNSLVKSASNSSNSSISKQTKSLTNNTYINSDLLKSVGITLNTDNTLSLDEKKLSEASASSLKTVFTNSGSFGDTTSTKASMIYNSANSSLNSGGIYNKSATSATSTLGSLFETYN